jgi:hypothetical protein
MPPKLDRKTKTLTQITKPSPQAAAPSIWQRQPQTVGAVPSKGQRLPSTGHGLQLWTAAASHRLLHPSSRSQDPWYRSRLTLAKTAAGTDGVAFG